MAGSKRIGKSSLAYYVYLIGKKDFGKGYEFIWLDGQSNHAASIALFCQAIARRSSLPYQAGEDKRTCLLNFEDAVENHAKQLVIILNEFERLVDINVQTAFDETFFSTLRYLAEQDHCALITTSQSPLQDLCKHILDISSPFYNIFVGGEFYEELENHADDEVEKGISRALLVQLRDTMQHKPRFIFILAGGHYLHELSVINWAEIFINAVTLKVSFLERNAGRVLLTTPVPNLNYQSESLIETILDLTGCQPYLLQAVASELIHALNRNNEKMATKAFVDEAVESVLSKSNNYFAYIWEKECHTEKHQDLLRLTASQNLSPNGHQQKTVAKTTLKSYSREVRDLIRKDVLRNENDTVQLTMPIIKLWLEKNQHIL